MSPATLNPDRARAMLRAALDNIVGPGSQHEHTCDRAEHDTDGPCIWCAARTTLALCPPTTHWRYFYSECIELGTGRTRHYTLERAEFDSDGDDTGWRQVWCGHKYGWKRKGGSVATTHVNEYPNYSRAKRTLEAIKRRAERVRTAKQEQKK